MKATNRIDRRGGTLFGGPEGPPYVVLATIAALLMAAACRDAPVEEMQTSVPVPVVTEPARVDTIQSVVNATGIVGPAPGADWIITAPEGGARIVELPKGEGDPVRPGDLLVRFEIPSLAAEVAAKSAELTQAEARLENAKAAAARVAGLFERGIAARKEVEDAERELAEAQAAVSQARSASAAAGVMGQRTVVRAQFAGVIAKRWHNPGDFVEPSSTDPVLRVIDPARLQVVASVPVSDLAQVVPGRRARILDPGGQASDATVLTKPAAVDPASATAEVRLSLARTANLTSGTAVQAEIMGEEHRGVVVVPSVAMVHEGDETLVVLAGPDNKAHRQKVEVGLTTRESTEIVSGVKAGDLVIVRGQEALPDDAEIAVAKP